TPEGGAPTDDVAIYDTSAAVDEERSLGELFSELSREATTLVRQEVRLAKMELSDVATQVGKNVGYLAVGGAIAYAGFLALLAALIVGLALWLNSLWLSALIVGLIVAAIGAYLAYQGYNNLKQIQYVPDETVESLKEDKEWLQKQV
ncbi:MAG: phage holin family protein, partial [Chloroflexota bacterium]|nr:phage holin family protein [Chloroflexota bacterium]